jgi:PhoPQ-activated pathogenicity-related protein
MGAKGPSIRVLDRAPVRPQGAETRTNLPCYLRRHDPDYSWKLIGRDPTREGVVHAIELTSQVWRGHVWTHDLRVYEPAGLACPDVILLLIVGGSNDRVPEPEDDDVGFDLARTCAARCAILRQVPNQPLLGGMMEDALIATSFLRYLEEGDEEWPVLFPMVKSAVRAMDALQAWAGMVVGPAAERFVVAGASKRGWTSWLTAALDDRIAAIAPMVFDTLDINTQCNRQLEVWGRYSEMIEDYSRRGLLGRDESTGVPRLWQLVDPYSYRDRIALPKLLINGTNDRYWPLDALNLYWDDLRGPKQVVYVPNAGHGPAAHHDLARRGVGALFRHVVAGRPLPALSWEHDATRDGPLRLRVEAEPAPHSARLWVARSSSRDFREAAWTPEPMRHDGSAWVGSVPGPNGGAVALFGDLTFEIEGLTYHLSTQIRQTGLGLDP